MPVTVQKLAKQSGDSASTHPRRDESRMTLCRTVESSFGLQDDYCNTVPSRMCRPFGRSALKSYRTDLAEFKIEMSLKVIAYEYRPAAGNRKLLARRLAVAIPFNDDGAVK